MGAFFALFASFLWVAALLHASQYMYHEENRTRFFVFVMITEAATLGVFLVRDFFSLFVFFEIMGLAAFPLVIHSETAPAKAAAVKYLFMAVVGPVPAPRCISLSELPGISRFVRRKARHGWSRRLKSPFLFASSPDSA